MKKSFFVGLAASFFLFYNFRVRSSRKNLSRIRMKGGSFAGQNHSPDPAIGGINKLNFIRPPETFGQFSLRIGEFYGTTIGKKMIMAVTGFLLYCFVLLHLAGNLKLFQGEQAINEYSAHLRRVGTPFLGDEILLWTVRLILMIAAGLHITAGYQLTLLDWASIPEGYAMEKYVAVERNTGTYASRTMRWGGVSIAGFTVYHLLHLTAGRVHRPFVPGNVYRNMITGFRIWYVSLIYIASMVGLGLHLHHGIWSLFHTLGWDTTRRLNRIWRTLAKTSSWTLPAGFISIPSSILLLSRDSHG